MRPPSRRVRDAQDCDDADAAINPDTLWYTDADGDGYGLAKSGVVRSCEAPEGFVADPGRRPSTPLEVGVRRFVEWYEAWDDR